MKRNSIIFLLLSCSVSAFAANGDKLCLQEGQNHLSRFYKTAIYKATLISAEVAEYSVGKIDGDVAVQYEYFAKTDQGDRYARVTMLKKGCKFMAADSHKSKQDMDSDDLDAAQGGGSY